MNLGEMIAAAREESQDTKQPYLWSDAEWKRFANQAQQEACRRARLIVDSRTVAVAQIDITAGEPSYDLDDRVLFIRRVKLASQSQPLRPISYKEMDARLPDWEDSVGAPSHYIKDQDAGSIRLYPVPTVNDTLNLTVIRLPLADMASMTGDSPEIKPHLHQSLIHWMLYRAYMKQDAETKDEKKALENLALFEQEFGQRSTAVDETWIHREHGYDEGEGLY